MNLRSCPEDWAVFFEWRKDVSKIWSDCVEVDVVNELLTFEEGFLAEELLEHPDIVIRHAHEGLEKAHHPSFDDEDKPRKVIFYNLPSIAHVLLKDIRSRHVGKLIKTEGIIQRATDVRMIPEKKAYRCLKCGRIVKISGDTKKCKCAGCGSSGSSNFERCEEDELIDFQRLRIQDYPEKLRGGENVRSIDVHVYNDLCGQVNVGNRVIVNAIVRTKQHRNSYETYLEAISFEVLERGYEEIELTEEDVRRIKNLASRPEITDLLVQSIAPSIYGYEDIKLAVAFQLFGGNHKVLPDGTKRRGDIHILLVGDPGVAKSILLQFVKSIAPRAIYVSSKGASGVGLTAIAVKDEHDGRWIYEAGALVLADRGLLCIDELDKMGDSEKDALHEALEQQTVTVSKAGGNVTFPARCAVLAAANPKFGRFDRYMPLAEQIDLKPSLISRFDLIFLLMDDPDAERDRRMAEHIFAIEDDLIPEPPIPPELLKKYVAYARKITPKFSEEAKKTISEFYISMRSDGKNGAIPITPRQLEALKRLAVASAKIRLDEIVRKEDAIRAVNLISRSLKDVAFDPETGLIDIDYICGTPKSVRDRIRTIIGIIKELGDYATEDEVIKVAMDEGMKVEDVKSALKRLKTTGEIYYSGKGVIRLSRE